MRHGTRPRHMAALGLSVLALSACDGVRSLDYDLRGSAGALDTTSAVRAATNDAPQPDTRGVVSYPDYQVALARRGDTVADVAARVGLRSEDLARYNALPEDVPLRGGEILALPRRVAEPATASGVDVTTIAGNAIARAENTPGLPAGDQPRRHKVEPGETAFSIARRYDVPVASLAEWNGLGADLNLRVGQYLLIPTRPDTREKGDVAVAALPPVTTTAPGVGSPTPIPPSAATPLPEKDVGPDEAEDDKPEPPKPLASQATAASDTSRLRMPVQGKITRAYGGSSDGIGLTGSAGAPVVAADDGTVAAITRDTGQVPIMVLRHDDNLLTVYAGLSGMTVNKGDRVKRGQKIGQLPSDGALHFEVREGFDSVDPVPYLN